MGNSPDRPQIHDRIHHWIHNWIHSFTVLNSIVLAIIFPALFACLAKCCQPYRPLLPVWRKIVEQQGFGWGLGGLLVKLLISSSCLQNKLSCIISPNQNYLEEQIGSKPQILDEFRGLVPLSLSLCELSEIAGHMLRVLAFFCVLRNSSRSENYGF